MKPITGQTVWGAQTSGTTTQLDNNFSLCITAINDLNTYPNYLVDTGTANSYVVTLPANITGALTDGLQLQVKFINANTGAATLAYNGGGALNILDVAGSALVAGAIPANGILPIQYRASDTVWLLQSSGVASGQVDIPVRQTALTGPISATTGLPTLIPASAANLTVTTANITSSAPIVVTVANGFTSAGGATNRIGASTANLSWANLTANSINYLGVTIAANGSLSTTFTAVAPVYQFGGAATTGNGNYTFNIQEMKMQAGNGSAAAQVWTVFLGEANCNSNAVVSAVSYAYMGRYRSPTVNTLPAAATRTAFAHNLGVIPLTFSNIFGVNITADANYTTGMVVPLQAGTGANPLSPAYAAWEDRNTASVVSGSTVAWIATNRTTGQNTNLTLANWGYYLYVERGW